MDKVTVGLEMNTKISVLMGIYNCSGTLEQAVRSIQKQTYPNWELILCDDGSTDDTYSKAARLAEQDDRIILLQNETNLGLNKTLNRCLKASSGAFIARMDGDDDCLPQRFERQIRFLQDHPEYAIVSSPMILFDEDGPWGETTAIERPGPEDVVTKSPICHAPVMIRREAIEAVGGYTEDPRRIRVEDVDLWIKLYAAGYRCYNLQEPLYRMRNDQHALQRRRYRYRVNSAYVRFQGCRLLHLGWRCRIKAVRPMINGLVPARLRKMIRRIQQRKRYK